MAAGIIAGIAQGAYQLATDIYDRWYQKYTNQRDFDYQKRIQKQIFEREDTAVQRRMADLKAAGLNPNLAAGSAAGAGSVVGRSSTPGLPGAGNPIGSFLDAQSAVAQLRAQRTQNQILQNEKSKSEAEARIANNEALLNNLELNNLLGLKSYLHWDDDKRVFVANWDDQQLSDTHLKELNAANSRLMQYLNWQYQNNKNSADLLQKDTDFYTADKIAGYFGAGAQVFSGIGSGWRNFNYSGNKNKRR